jgi:hypothetical protein
MNRRQFLQLSSASALLAGCDTGSWLAAIPPWLPVSVLKPAMREGHYLRQLKQLPRSLGTRKVDTVIIGSGVAGLTAAWRLSNKATIILCYSWERAVWQCQWWHMERSKLSTWRTLLAIAYTRIDPYS